MRVEKTKEKDGTWTIKVIPENDLEKRTIDKTVEKAKEKFYKQRN